MLKFHAFIRSLFILFAAMLIVVNPVTLHAAGMQSGDRDRTQDQLTDQVNDQLRVRDGSGADTVITSLLDADQDQDQIRLQLRDGTCDTGCDGVPDQDRDRLGQE